MCFSQEGVAFSEITLIKKFKSALTTTLELMVDPAKKYTFSSFFDSEEAYNVLNFLWQNRVKSGPILISGYAVFVF